MTFLRAIWADLVEKRLWPLAAVLLVALVALPVVLLRGGSADATAPPVPLPPPAAAPASAPTAGVVHLAGAASGVAAQPPKGAYRDPFSGQPHASAPGHPSAAPASAAPASHHAAPVAAPAPAAGTPAAPAPAPSASPSPTVRGALQTARSAPAYPAGYTADVAWGHVARAAERHDLLRLSRLMAGDTPAVVYLGVRDDRRTAMFLLAPGVVPSSTKGCMPSPRNGADRCEILQLKAGHTGYLDVTVGAAVERFELDVDRIARLRAGSERGARRALTRESHAGRQAMYRLIRSGRDYVTHFMYSSKLGVVVKQPIKRQRAVWAGPWGATGQ